MQWQSAITGRWGSLWEELQQQTVLQLRIKKNTSRGQADDGYCILPRKSAELDFKGQGVEMFSNTITSNVSGYNIILEPLLSQQ